MNGLPQVFAIEKGIDMTQSQINRAVARATGESLGTIVRRGFSIERPGEADFDEDDPQMRPSVVDGDAIDAARCRSAA